MAFHHFLAPFPPQVRLVGHRDEPVQLLETLRFHKPHADFQHPVRKVIFKGDFINRGPKIRQELEIVRSMIDEEKARRYVQSRVERLGVPSAQKCEGKLKKRCATASV